MGMAKFEFEKISNNFRNIEWIKQTRPEIIQDLAIRMVEHVEKITVWPEEVEERMKYEC